MNQRQYVQSLRNRTLSWPQPIGQSRAFESWLREAAISARRRQQAEQAWVQVAEPGWLTSAAPVGWHDGVLTIEVSDAALLEVVQRRREALERQLRGRIPGIRRLFFQRREH